MLNISHVNKPESNGLTSTVTSSIQGASRTLFDNEWLNTEEAAKYLGIPVGTLRNLTSIGRVPYYKLLGTRLNRYLRSELRELLLANKRGGNVHGF